MNDFVGIILGGAIAFVGGVVGGMFLERMSQRFSRTERKLHYLEEICSGALRAKRTAMTYGVVAARPDTELSSEHLTEIADHILMKAELHVPELVDGARDLSQRAGNVVESWIAFMEDQIKSRSSDEDFKARVVEPIRSVHEACDGLIKQSRGLAAALK